MSTRPSVFRGRWEVRFGQCVLVGVRFEWQWWRTSYDLKKRWYMYPPPHLNIDCINGPFSSKRAAVERACAVMEIT